MITRYLPALGCSVALHVLACAAVVWLTWPSPPRVNPEAPNAKAIAAFIVAPEDSRFPGLNPVDDMRNDWMIEAADRSHALSIRDFRFDTARIADHAQVLFPFLTPGVALEHFALTPEQHIIERLRNPLAPVNVSKPAANRLLTIDDVALQTVVDKSWSRRDRWSAFKPIRTLAEKYNADAGRLPNLLQAYCEQNSLQPYVDTTIRDPLLWVQLGIAAEHVDFIGFIRRYASEHPSTKATTALLFLLDNIAQASQDALLTLLEIAPVKDLAWTRDANPDAYGLVTELQRHYRRELDRRDLTSAEAITRYYEKVRLEILTGIVRTSPNGYRVNDARFLIGGIYWRQQRFDEALRTWRAITVDPDDSYVGAYSQILRALEVEGPVPSVLGGLTQPSRDQQIRRILKNENGRWLTFSYDRLRHFGYRFDTF